MTAITRSERRQQAATGVMDGAAFGRSARSSRGLFPALAVLVVLAVAEATTTPPPSLRPAAAPYSLVFESTVGPVERPSGLGLGPDGALYITDSERAHVTMFTADGVRARTFGVESDAPTAVPGQLLSPLGVVVHPDGRVLVSDLGTGAINAFDAGGRYLSDFASDTIEAIAARPGVLVASELGLLVCDLAGHRVLLLGWDGTLLRVFAPPADEPLSYPNGAWASRDGSVYVSDTNHDRVVVFGASGAYGGTVVRGVTNPRGIVGDDAGRLYVVETLTDRVAVVDATSGRLLHTLVSANGHGLGFPTAIALREGRLMVADRAAAGVYIWRINGAEGGSR